MAAIDALTIEIGDPRTFRQGNKYLGKIVSSGSTAGSHGPQPGSWYAEPKVIFEHGYVSGFGKELEVEVIEGGLEAHRREIAALLAEPPRYVALAPPPPSAAAAIPDFKRIFQDEYVELDPEDEANKIVYKLMSEFAVGTPRDPGISSITIKQHKDDPNDLIIEIITKYSGSNYIKYNKESKILDILSFPAKYTTPEDRIRKAFVGGKRKTFRRKNRKSRKQSRRSRRR
jgi:hypothetical protein